MRLSRLLFIALLLLLSNNRLQYSNAFDKIGQPHFIRRTREVINITFEERLAHLSELDNPNEEATTKTTTKLVRELWRFGRKKSITAIGGLASRLMSHETITAAKTIRSILASVDDHGVIDVFSKYSRQDLIASVFALSRIQAACRQYERLKSDQTMSHENDFPDDDLLDELRYYAPFASAAYGWKLDLATAGRLHRGDRQALVKMTGVDLEDIVSVNWESRTNRPAFYIVRDRQRKRIVLSIRGTWSAHDVLTDLCCTSEEFYVGRSHYKAHNGMLAAAREVSTMAEEIVSEELENNPGYSLLLVGHSLGGSVAAILGTLWGEKFEGTKVYAYGAACVSPEHDRGGCPIVSVLLEGDPFSCLSLGHVADISCALAYLCENDALRNTILMRTDGPTENLEDRDLEWCAEAMQEIHEQMNGEKLFPPGRLLYISDDSKSRRSECIIREVPKKYFKELRVGPLMFDLSRHIPRLYEARLKNCKCSIAEELK